MFEWRDYLEFARTLIALSEHTEASLGTAASRAYYAAFHKSREALERERGGSFGRDNVHAEVIRRLKEEAKTQTLGGDLDRLRRIRAHADYNAASAFPSRHAELAVELASGVLRGLDVA